MRRFSLLLLAPHHNPTVVILLVLLLFVVSRSRRFSQTLRIEDLFRLLEGHQLAIDIEWAIRIVPRPILIYLRCTSSFLKHKAALLTAVYDVAVLATTPQTTLDQGGVAFPGAIVCRLWLLVVVLNVGIYHVSVVIFAATLL